MGGYSFIKNLFGEAEKQNAFEQIIYAIILSPIGYGFKFLIPIQYKRIPGNSCRLIDFCSKLAKALCKAGHDNL